MEFLRRSLKIVALVVLLVVLTAASSLGVWLLWWNAPVSVEAVKIEKVIDSDIHEDRVDFCAAFSMTPDEFRAYWKDVRPIFDFEVHDYSLGSCYLKATEGNREYAIGIGGLGMVTKGDTTYYYVRKGAKSDLIPDSADMK